MATCIICRFETEMDDIAIAGSGGRCVCLRCFTRETDTAVAMPKELRREIESALAAVA